MSVTNPIHNEEFETFKQSLLKDLNPTTSLLTFLAMRIIAIAWRLLRLDECEFDILQNEATRVRENQLVQWRQQRMDHIAKYGAYDKNHPTPPQPPIEDHSNPFLLAHAFSPTLKPENTPARNIPTLSPYERYLKFHMSLDKLHLRLLATYEKLQKSHLQNKPNGGGGGGGVDRPPSVDESRPPQKPILQNKPNGGGVDRPPSVDENPSAPKPPLQNKPTLPTNAHGVHSVGNPDLQNEPDLQNKPNLQSDLLGPPSSSSSPSSLSPQKTVLQNEPTLPETPAPPPPASSLQPPASSLQLQPPA